MMKTKLKRIAKQAREDKEMKFSTLIYLVNDEALKQCHHEKKRHKAAGKSGMTKS